MPGTWPSIMPTNEIAIPSPGNLQSTKTTKGSYPFIEGPHMTGTLPGASIFISFSPPKIS